jgi:hypothetical protein
VRVHSDRKSSESARKMNALSYTVRQNIVFADGRYDPRALEGRRLIAHELAHTIQQDNQPRPLALHSEPIVQRQDDGTPDPSPKDSSELGATATPPSPASGLDQLPKGDAPNCIAAPGPPPALSNCAEYAKNSWWLPLAYVVNASCACLSTPNSPTANCVRKFLQDRLAATPSSLKSAAVAARAAQAAIPYSPPGLGPYDVFVQTVLTPRIYQDHVDAYQSCCCPSGPAPYASWVAVTTVPIPVCSLVGWFIDQFGSCHGTKGVW